jgi:hypothetical protein
MFRNQIFLRRTGSCRSASRLILWMALLMNTAVWSGHVLANPAVETAARSLVADVARVVQAGGPPASMASQIRDLIEALVPDMDEQTQYQIFAQALTYGDDVARVLLAEQILDRIVPADVRGDADAVAAAVMPVLREIPPVPGEQGDRNAAAASLMMALSKLVPLDVFRACSAAVVTAVSSVAPSILGAVTAGAIIGAGTDSPAVLASITSALASNEAALQVVNQAALNPAIYIPAGAVNTFNLFSTMERPAPIPPFDAFEPNVVTDPLTTTTPRDTTTPQDTTTQPLPAPLDPATGYQGQVN